MAGDVEIERRFWKELKASPFMMLGLDGVDDGRSRPMTAFFEDGHDPLWFFASTEIGLVDHLANHQGRHQAIASYSARGHDLFASLHGHLTIDTDPAVIDRFWNRDVAGWYEGGRQDPRLVMLRLEADHARIWLGASSFAAPIRRLFGQNPQRSYAGRVAEVLL